MQKKWMIFGLIPIAFLISGYVISATPDTRHKVILASGEKQEFILKFSADEVPNQQKYGLNFTKNFFLVDKDPSAINQAFTESKWLEIYNWGMVSYDGIQSDARAVYSPQDESAGQYMLAPA